MLRDMLKKASRAVKEDKELSILWEISEKTREAALHNNLLPMFRLQVLLHADKLANYNGEGFCAVIDVPLGYANEYERMIAIRSYMLKNKMPISEESISQVISLQSGEVLSKNLAKLARLDNVSLDIKTSKAIVAYVGMEGPLAVFMFSRKDFVDYLVSNHQADAEARFLSDWMNDQPAGSVHLRNDEDNQRLNGIFRHYVGYLMLKSECRYRVCCVECEMVYSSDDIIKKSQNTTHSGSTILECPNGHIIKRMMDWID